MTQQEAVKVLEKMRDDLLKCVGEPTVQTDALTRAIDALRWRSVEEWIPTEERLPEVGQAVWATHRHKGDVRCRTFEEPYDAEYFVDIFSAWMPRQTEPEPYGGKDDQ